MDLRTLFKRHKKLLSFAISPGHRMQDDIDSGISDLQIYHDYLTFTGKLYDDPVVVIMYTDIKSLNIEFDQKPRRIKKITIEAKTSPGTHYRNPPGPDL